MPMDVVSAKIREAAASIISSGHNTHSIDAMRHFFIIMGIAHTSLTPKSSSFWNTYSMFCGFISSILASICHSVSMASPHPIDHIGHAAGAETVVDIDDGHAGGAAVEHSQQS